MLWESVKVIDGPFNSFIGFIEEIDEQKKKLKVTVRYLVVKLCRIEFYAS